MYLVTLLSAIFFVVSYTNVDATICKPLSPFKIDCDICRCSADGTEYTCFTRDCDPVIKENENTIVPRNEPYPYKALQNEELRSVNDETRSNRDVFDNEFEDDSSSEEVRLRNDNESYDGEDDSNNEKRDFNENKNIEIPYLNDEIPPSGEEFNSEPQDDSNEISYGEDNNMENLNEGSENLQDLSEIENRIPKGYRYKRFSRGTFLKTK